MAKNNILNEKTHCNVSEVEQNFTNFLKIDLRSFLQKI